jgi:hypothetical protein
MVVFKAVVSSWISKGSEALSEGCETVSVVPMHCYSEDDNSLSNRDR